MNLRSYFILPLFLTLLTSCNSSTGENGVGESEQKKDFKYKAEVRIFLMPPESQAFYNSGDDSEFYTNSGFEKLVLSKELYSKTCTELGLNSSEVQNEITIETLPKTDIVTVTAFGMDTLGSKVFLEKLIALTSDSIVQSIREPLNDSLVLIETAIAVEKELLNTPDISNFEYSEYQKIYAKLKEQQMELQLRKSTVVSRMLYVDWWFKRI